MKLFSFLDLFETRKKATRILNYKCAGVLGDN